MALIKCPECNQEVSDKAKTCPHCGNPMKKRSLPDFSNLKKKPPKNLIIVGLVIVVIVAAIAGVTAFRNMDPYERLAHRVAEIQKDPQIADAQQIESDIDLMIEVCQKWNEESSEIIDEIIMVWEDGNRIHAYSEPVNQSFTEEYTNNAVSENDAILKYKDSKKYKDYNTRSEKIGSNLSILNQHKNNSVTQSDYLSEDLVDLSNSTSWYFAGLDQLFHLATKDLGSSRLYESYTPDYSKENGERDLYPQFIEKDKNKIGLNDYCAMTDFIKGGNDYSYNKVNERRENLN